MPGNDPIGGVGSPAPSGPRLRAWRRGEWLGEWALGREHPLRIGRSRHCAVTLDDPTVSREHLEVRPVDGGWEAVDLGSSAGTFCNGERIERRLLRSGDQLAIGDSLFEAVGLEAAAPVHQMGAAPGRGLPGSRRI